MENGTAQAIQKLSTFHEMLANWILANPGATYRQMGAAFQYSPAWLCTVVNSDLFKAYMAEKMKDVNSRVLDDIPSMLKGTAALAIERMNDVLTHTEDSKTIVDAFDSVMHRYGYAPNAKAAPAAQGPLVQQNNVFFLSKEDLGDARKKLLEAHQPQAPAEKVISGELVPPT